MADGMEGLADEPQEAPAKDKRPLTEEGTPDTDGETLHVPSEFLQGTHFKEGDELVLKVVSVDDEGLEVAYAKAPPGEEGDVGSQLDAMDAASPTY